MIRQSGAGENPKKRFVSPKTGSQEGDQTGVLIDDEIDPADFFDPEEFGYRRHRETPRP